MQTYNTLKILNIITFLEIMQEGNANMLDKDFTEDKQYTEEEVKQLNELWLNLYDKYFELKNDNIAKSYLSSQHKLFNLELKILILSKQHDVLAKLQDFEYSEKTAEIKIQCINAIKETEPRIKLNIFDDIVTVCTKIQSVLKALNNELGTIKVNQDKRAEKAKTNVYNVIANVEQTLERPIGDITKVNVEQFIAYEEIAKNIIKSKETKNKK